LKNIKNEGLYCFIEQNFNIKLLPYQKILLSVSNKIDRTFNIRHHSKKLDNYILLLRYALFMKDDETISIVSPKEIKTMNREELFNWLQNEYWS
jgi:hypothetical protein